MGRTKLGKSPKPPERVREDETRAWALRIKGYTQARIAAELGLTPSTISKMLDRIERRVLEEMSESVQRVKARQTGQLWHIYSEAMAAWRRSKEAAVTVKVTRMRMEREGQEGPEFEVKTETTTRTTAGTPAFLSEARNALADIRRIWGLDAKQDDPPQVVVVNSAAAGIGIAAALEAVEMETRKSLSGPGVESSSIE